MRAERYSSADSTKETTCWKPQSIQTHAIGTTEPATVAVLAQLACGLPPRGTPTDPNVGLFIALDSRASDIVDCSK